MSVIAVKPGWIPRDCNQAYSTNIIITQNWFEYLISNFNLYVFEINMYLYLFFIWKNQYLRTDKFLSNCFYKIPVNIHFNIFPRHERYLGVNLFLEGRKWWHFYFVKIPYPLLNVVVLNSTDLPLSIHHLIWQNEIKLLARQGEPGPFHLKTVLQNSRSASNRIIMRRRYLAMVQSRFKKIPGCVPRGACSWYLCF